MTEYRTLLSNFVKKSTTVGLLKNDGTIDTTSYLSSHQDITGKEDKSNKVTSWNNTTNDIRYPTEKLFKDSLDAKANNNHNHRIFDIDNTSHGGTNAIVEDCDYNNEGFGFADGLLIFNQQNYKLYYDKNSGADSDNGNELATLSNIPSQYDIIDTVNIALGHMIDNWDDYQ